MKSINEQALNQINIAGKLLDITFREGTTSDGRPYESASMTVRVTQTYGGKEEISEIPVSMFATKMTLAGKPSATWQQVQDLKKAKTAQNVGIEEADSIRINRGSIRENNFVSKNSGQLINGWQINTNFMNIGGGNEVASFNMDIYIMDMKDEMDREGDPTGRLLIKGGVVQYNGTLDVLEFIVEEPDAVKFINLNWESNTTVNVKGRIRVTATEVTSGESNSSWGEDIPEVTTRTVRELIITKGSDEPKDEEFAYDPAEIKKAFNVRKAKLEQKQVDATTTKPKASEKVESMASKYSWE